MGLRGEERGQAIQIGAVLLFGVLIIIFAAYQAFVVPNQNRAVEFNHNQRVQGDMVEVRNAILETKSTGEDGYAAVELGTEFPPRLVALNPTNPSGRLGTTGLRPITIEQGGTDITTQVCPGDDVRTRFLRYAPNYAVYQGAGTIRYENSLLYHDFGDQVFRMAEQNLVRGQTLRVIPLRESFNVTGSRTVAVEPVAGKVRTSEREDITVTLPTALSESAWEAALAGQVDPENVTVSAGPTGQVLTLSLGGTYTIDCGPVGLGATPPSGARGEGRNEINPAAPGDIRLIDERRSGSTLELDFNNTAGTNNFTAGRINFYQAQGGQAPTQANISVLDEPVSATMGVREDYVSFDPVITLRGNGTVTTVVMEFDRNLNQNDWFVMTLELETGQQGLYFVPIP